MCYSSPSFGSPYFRFIHKTKSTEFISPWNVYTTLQFKLITISTNISSTGKSTGKTIYRNQATGDMSNILTYITIDIKDELDKVILKQNRKYFAKAKNTPWNNPPPSKNINKDTDYDLEKNIQENPIHLPANSTTETLTVLELLKKLTIINTPKCLSNITFEQFIDGL